MTLYLCHPSLSPLVVHSQLEVSLCVLPLECFIFPAEVKGSSKSSQMQGGLRSQFISIIFLESSEQLSSRYLFLAREIAYHPCSTRFRSTDSIDLVPGVFKNTNNISYDVDSEPPSKVGNVKNNVALFFFFIFMVSGSMNDMRRC